MPRYRLYREHKFVSLQVSDLAIFIAKVDFADFKQIAEVKNKLEAIIHLMEHHGKHEEERIHPLLRKKDSQLIKTIELEHQGHKTVFEDLNKKLAEIEAINKKENEKVKKEAKEEKERLVTLGYEFYLAYRNFVAINLMHINEEENIIMPELQKYYTDKEIKETVDFPVYEIMNAGDMVDMVSVLFPTMNIDDKEVFLKDLNESQPEKFLEAWPKIALILDQKERSQLIEKFVRISAGF